MAPPRTKSQRPAQPPRGASGVQLGETEARMRILGGTTELLLAGGVREVSVEDILRAASVSRRTFYKLYRGKEDVLAAMYQLGTERLLEACRVAMSEQTDPIKQIEGCIEAHLRNAKELARLVFVLGGEAQRHESALHEPRMEVHTRLVSLLMSSTAASASNLDPLLVRGLVLALEGVTRMVLEEGDEGRNVSDASIERARRVMVRMATAALVGVGPGVGA